MTTTTDRLSKVYTRIYLSLKFNSKRFKLPEDRDIYEKATDASLIAKRIANDARTHGYINFDDMINIAEFFADVISYPEETEQDSIDGAKLFESVRMVDRHEFQIDELNSDLDKCAEEIRKFKDAEENQDLIISEILDWLNKLERSVNDLKNAPSCYDKWVGTIEKKQTDLERRFDEFVVKTNDAIGGLDERQEELSVGLKGARDHIFKLKREIEYLEMKE